MAEGRGAARGTGGTVEGLVVEMEGPVVGLRGRWRDRWRDRGADGGAGVERAWRGTEGLQVVRAFNC